VEGKGCWLVDEDGKKYLGEFCFGCSFLVVVVLLDVWFGLVMD
jgi:hypothetical protein